jgi:hypothetical protein
MHIGQWQEDLVNGLQVKLRLSKMTVLSLFFGLFMLSMFCPSKTNGEQIVASDSTYAAAVNNDFDPNKVMPAENKIEQLKALSRFQPSSNEVKAAKLLLAFRDSDMRGEACKRFYSDMAAQGLRMTDIIRTKTWIEDAAIKNPTIADDFLGNKFSQGGSTVEQALLAHRRQLTRDIISQVAREFAGRSSGHSVYLAEIGKWVGQTDKSLTFSGDIDFSFVSLDENLSYAMKQRYDAIVKEKTGLSAVDFDSVCTAHGRATPDVYIGEHGRMYGDEAMREGVLKEFDLQKGTISSVEIAGKDVIDQMLKENEARRVQSGEIPPSTKSKEPGLSMEMVRHFNHDIVAPTIFDPIDSILKASKYVDRSNDAMKGTDATVSDPKLAEFAKKITAAAKKSDFKTIAKLLKGQFGDSLSFTVVSEGGRPKAKLAANNDVINNFFQTCNKAMWANACSGFANRLKDLDQKIRELDESPGDDKSKVGKIEQLRADMVALADMIKAEMLACEYSHLEVPAKIKQMQLELNAKIAAFLKRKGARALSEDELKQKKFIEDLIRSEKKPLHKIAMAAVADFASRSVDGMNRILDVFDDKLLGELRAESPEFEELVVSIRRTRADEAKGKQTGVMASLADMKSKAASVIRSANNGLNEQLNATAARRGAMKVMSGVNLSQEINAYYQAYSSEGYKGLATEYFKRRIPTGAVWDAYYQENYLRTGIELVYLIFPPLAIPEGLYGMVETVADYGVGKWRGWQYNDMVDKLYKDAVFEDTPQVKLVSISYDCGGKLIVLDRANASKLPSRCPEVWRIIASQIKTYPVLAVYEEMLGNASVSSGHDSIFPYTYSGLSSYGKSLQTAYRKQVDKVNEDYFKGVIEELEKRRNFNSGNLYARILEIGKEIGCSRPIVEKNQLSRKQLEDLIGQYDAMKKSNLGIKSIKTRWNADFIEMIQPSCSPISIKESSVQAATLLGKLKEAVNRARIDVEKIVGQEEAQKFEIVQPATYCSLGMAAMPAAEYAGWLNKYNGELAKLKRKVARAKLLCPSSVYIGDKVEIVAEYDRPNDKRTARWEFSEGPPASFSSSDVDKASWTAAKAGRYVIRLRFKESPEWTNELESYATVEVIPAPSFKIELSAVDTTLSQNEIAPVEVRVVSNRENDPVVRYFWSENGKRTSASAEDSYNFSASGKAGKIALSVTARTESGRSSEATIYFTVQSNKSGSLRVFIIPAGAGTVSESESLALRSSVLKTDFSGTLKYQWTVDGKVISNDANCSFAGKGYVGKTVKVRLYVQQVDGSQLKAEGSAEKSITVNPEGSLSVTLSSCPNSIKLGKNLELRVLQPSEESGDYKFAWYEWNGSRWSDNSYGSQRNYSLAARSEGQVLRLKVVVSDNKGRTASAETGPVKVVAEATKSEKDNLEKSKTTTAKPDQKDPRERLNIIAPDSVVANQPFTATVEIPADLVGKIGKITFAGGVEILESSGNSAKMLFNLGFGLPARNATSGPSESPEKIVATAELLNQADGRQEVVWGAKPILVRGVFLKHSSPVPGNWTESQDLNGTYFTRDEVILKGNNPEASGSALPPGRSLSQTNVGISTNTAHVKAKITIRNKYSKKSEAECLSELNKVPMGKADQKIEAQPFAISDCKGYRRELSGLECSSGDLVYTRWLGSAFVRESSNELLLDYNVSGSGRAYIIDHEDPTKTVDDLPVLKPESEKAINEIKTIIAGLSIGTEENKEQKKLVKLSANKSALLSGETALVSCKVDAGADLGPLDYEWSGNHAGKGAQVDFMASKPGKHSLTVTVRGKSGAIGSDTIEFTVGDFQPVIQPIPQSVTYGQSLDLKINLPVDAKTKYSIAWHSEPATLFAQPSSTVGQNKIKFNRMGNVKIWAQVKRLTGGDEQSAECKQVSTTVKAPKFKITFTPPAGAKLGQEVKAVISESPMVEDALVDFKWENPPSSNRLEESKNARTISFKLKNAASALKVSAISSAGNEPIGDEITATYKSTPYVVSARLVEPGVKPMVWDPVRKGLFPIAKGTYAGDERVTAEASIEAVAAPERVSWLWRCNEGTSISNNSSKSPTLSRHETGTVEATVTARDADGTILGSATVSFHVTVPVERINKVKELKVSLTPERRLLKSGETTLLSATIEGGTAPYKLTWAPALERKSDLVSVFKAGKAGDFSIELTVLDAKGISAKATVALRVEKVSLLVKIASKTPTVTLGETASLDAIVSGGIAPYTYTWSKGVEASQANGRFTARSPGNQTVAVEAIDTCGNKGTASLAFNVLIPQIKLTLSPTPARIGENFSASLQIPESLKTLATEKRWTSPLPGSYKIVGDGKIEMLVQSSKPITVAADLIDKSNGSVLSHASQSVSVQALKMTIETEVKPPRAKLWNPAKKALEELSTGKIAIGETVNLKAKIANGTIPPSASFQWTCPNAKLIGSTRGESISVIPSFVGSTTAACELRNKAGELIAQASSTITVNVSANDLENAQEAQSRSVATATSSKTSGKTTDWNVPSLSMDSSLPLDKSKQKASWNVPSLSMDSSLPLDKSKQKTSWNVPKLDKQNVPAQKAAAQTYTTPTRWNVPDIKPSTIASQMPVAQAPPQRTQSQVSVVKPAAVTQSLPQKINAVLENRDSQNIHLWSHGEVGCNAYNKVLPTASINRAGLQIQSGFTNVPGVVFWAGRDGRELATRKWVGNPHVPEGGTLRVVWDGSKIRFAGEGNSASDSQIKAAPSTTIRQGGTTGDGDNYMAGDWTLYLRFALSRVATPVRTYRAFLYRVKFMPDGTLIRPSDLLDGRWVRTGNKVKIGNQEYTLSADGNWLLHSDGSVTFGRGYITPFPDWAKWPQSSFPKFN